jgi:glutathione S-transferase
MYKLYWETLSGSIGPHIMLEELGTEYSLHHIDMAKMEHRGAAYRAICPSMRVPALQFENGAVIGETSAIMLILGERHSESPLVPRPSDEDRPRFLYWLLHMATQGYPTFSRSWHPEQFTDERDGEAGIKRIANRNLAAFFQTLEDGVKGEASFLERGFSCLDIYLTMLTLWMPDRDAFLSRHLRIGDVCDAVESRPSYRKVAQLHGLVEDPVPAAR